MNRFEQVKTILDDSVNNENIGAHQAFWRNTTRIEFVAKVIFGFPLVEVGNGGASNLVKALRGEAPFGVDLPSPPPGAIFSRMPASRPPVADGDIEFISQWIDDGCPDEPDQPTAVFDNESEEKPESIVHNDLWREFDNWAMFQVTPEVNAALGQFMPRTQLWRTFAVDATQEDAWATAIVDPPVRQAIDLLAEKQFQSFQSHFGLPIPLAAFLDAYERFGDNSLPDDPQRPQDQRHNMNGTGMWFIWSAFCDACLRLDIRRPFWLGMCRGVIIGEMSDGLFRGRFDVSGFTADLDGKIALRSFVRNLNEDELQQQLAIRFVDSGLSP